MNPIKTNIKGKKPHKYQQPSQIAFENQNTKTTMTMKYSASGEPLILEDAHVCSVGKRLSATLPITTDIRPSKLPLALLHDYPVQPLPLHRELPMISEDGRVTNLDRHLPLTQKNAHSREEPVDYACLLVSLNREIDSTNLKPAHHAHRHLVWKDIEVSALKRHFHLRTTEHYCPVNKSNAGDPVPDSTFDKPRSKSVPVPLSDKLPLTPADSRVFARKGEEDEGSRTL